MQRTLPLILAALDAALTALIGLAVPLLFSVLLWATTLGFGDGLAEASLAAVRAWQEAHGAGIDLVVPATQAAEAGITGGDIAMHLSLAPLGLTIITAALAYRAGRRLVDLGSSAATALAAIVGFALVALLVEVVAEGAGGAMPATVSFGAAVLCPAAVYSVALLIGWLVSATQALDAELARPAGGSGTTDALVTRTAEALRRALPGPMLHGLLRAPTAAVAAVVALVGAGALVTALALMLSFGRVVAVSQSLHLDAAGAVLLTIAQLLALPTAALFGLAWATGPGFALGVGSHVSMLGSDVGPVPAIPLIGAVPEQQPALALAAVLLPLFAAAAAGFTAWHSAAWAREAARGPEAPWAGLAAFAVVTGVLVAGIMLGPMALASGGIGPGRLAEFGPVPWAAALASGLFAAAGTAGGAWFALTRQRAETARRAPLRAVGGDDTPL